LIEKMNREGPAWCRQPDNMKRIVKHMRGEAKQRGFWIAIAASLPFAKYPIQALVIEAIEAAEAEIIT
jgi:hypothetical protein